MSFTLAAVRPGTGVLRWLLGSVPCGGNANLVRKTSMNAKPHNEVTTETVPWPFLGPPRQPGDLGCLAQYRVLKVLGQGGMGLVFLAEDQQLGRPTALKVMRP